MSRRNAVVAATIATLVLGAPQALAQDEWKEDNGEKPPPDDRPARKKDDGAQVDPDAASRKWLLELKFGPAFLLASRGVTEFGLQINLGYTIARDLITKDDSFYLTFSPYMLVGEDLTLVTPLGAQYDLPLKMIPYEGISAYARVSVGYAYYKPPLVDFDKGYHGLGVQPAVGAKLAFLKRFHVGIEPFGFDIVSVFPPKSTQVSGGTNSVFQLYIFGGMKF
ncbi:MAG: hypothetical protein IPK82_09445 [Polyangiaceae bacterium]|nr:hypothetical protein [Polyangiaceae bacterium]